MNFFVGTIQKKNKSIPASVLGIFSKKEDAIEELSNAIAVANRKSYFIILDEFEVDGKHIRREFLLEDDFLEEEE